MKTTPAKIRTPMKVAIIDHDGTVTHVGMSSGMLVDGLYVNVAVEGQETFLATSVNVYPIQFAEKVSDAYKAMEAERQALATAHYKRKVSLYQTYGAAHQKAGT